MTGSKTETEIEDEHTIWILYWKKLKKILSPPETIEQLFTYLSKRIGSTNIADNLMKILKIDIGAPQAEETQTQGKEPPAPNAQSGGNLFCHTNDKFTYYRLESYNDLMSYLSENNVRISLLTKQLLKKMYLYHYTLDYVKALNYILFKVKQHSLPPKLRYILSNVFDQIGNKIYNTMNV